MTAQEHAHAVPPEAALAYGPRVRAHPRPPTTAAAAPTRLLDANALLRAAWLTPLPATGTWIGAGLFRRRA